MWIFLLRPTLRFPARLPDDHYLFTTHPAYNRNSQAGNPAGRSSRRTARKTSYYFVSNVFLGKEQPRLTFDDGLDVVRMLMTAYMSAEQEKTLAFPPRGLDKFVPAVAKGEWKP